MATKATKVRTFLAMALAAAGTVDLFAPDGKRAGRIVEGPGGQVDVFDKESRRVGWGRCDPRGDCEVFDMQGNRIGESRGGRIVVDPAWLRDPKRRR